MGLTDAAVWQEVCRLLENPARLEREYRQCLLPKPQPYVHEGQESLLGKLRRGIARLILGLFHPDRRQIPSGVWTAIVDAGTNHTHIFRHHFQRGAS